MIYFTTNFFESNKGKCDDSQNDQRPKSELTQNLSNLLMINNLFLFFLSNITVEISRGGTPLTELNGYSLIYCFFVSS